MQQKHHKKIKLLWGSKPPLEIQRISKKILPGGKALDLGFGEGRNSIFLARKGFIVDAVDKKDGAVTKATRFAKSKNVFDVNFLKRDFRNLNLKPNYYNLVVAWHSLDFLKVNETRTVIQKTWRALKPGGYVCVSVFSKKDPAFKRLLSEPKRKMIDSQTFFIPKFKNYRHFFLKQELKKLFKRYKNVKLKEKGVTDFHPGIGIHRHVVIEITAKKGG